MRRIATTVTALLAGSILILATRGANAAPRTHDGFYLGIDAGLGYLSSSASVNGADYGKLSGVMTDTALWLGGTLGPVVVGGGFVYGTAFSPKFTLNGQSSSLNDVSVSLIALGPFVDVYPDPTSGLHFSGFLGWGGLETTYQGNSGGSDPTGLVTMLGGGYDFWVANEWSIGPLARLTYAPLSLNSMDYSTLAFIVAADFKYH